MWGRNDSRLTLTAAGNISDVGKVGWAAGKPTEYLANKRSRSHRSSSLVCVVTSALSYLRQWKPKCSVNFIVQEVFRQAPHFAYISASPWKSRDFSKCIKGNFLHGKNVKTGSKGKQSRWSRHCCRGPMAPKHQFCPWEGKHIGLAGTFHAETCAFCWKQHDFTSAVQAWMNSAFQLHFFTFFPWTWHLAVVKQALLISESGTGTRNACCAADHVLQAAIALGLEFSCLFYKLILAKHVSHSPCLSKSLMSLD